MIKFIYFSHLFSLITLLIFFQTWRFSLINTSLFILSISFDVISIYILFFKRISIHKKSIWFITNTFVNLAFISGILYLASVSFLLKDV